MVGGLKPSEKYTLLIREAAEYFGIGIKRMRRLAENNDGYFSFYAGNRYVIIRPKFEEYLLKKAERRTDSYAESGSRE